MKLMHAFLFVPPRARFPIYDIFPTMIRIIERNSIESTSVSDLAELKQDLRKTELES